MVDFTLTFKFDVPQVLWKVMKCYFQPLVQLLCKFSDHLSQTVKRRGINFTIVRKMKKKKTMQSQNVAVITATDGKNEGNKSAVTCRAGPAGQWASAPQRWLCRGWSHTPRRCSPPSGSPGLAACGGACPARSGAGSSGPKRPHIQHEIQQHRWWENSLKCPDREFNEERSPRQSWLGWRCPVSSDSGSCTSWWRWKPVGGNIPLSQRFSFHLQQRWEKSGRKTRR